MLVINILGFALISLIVWWFWLYKPSDGVVAEGTVPITVNNGVYTPAQVRVMAGEKLTLSFLRKDNSPCSSIVQFNNLEISEELPLNKTKEISLESLKPGIYPFSCQMQMYRGELIVEGKDDE
jgi:plastocyanin domain-containing protein